MSHLLPLALIRALNALNADFYARIAPEFDATRSQAWQGWQTILSHLPAPEALARPLRVLDVGCGNGRFGVFLAQAGYALDYTGLDNSAALLAFADADLAALSSASRYQLASLDIVEALLAPAPLFETARYDVVGMFGVMHHIPDSTLRLRLMRELSSGLANAGILAWAAWRFADFAKYQARRVALPPELSVYQDQLEGGDAVLDWRRGAHALRYCHHVDDAEHQALDAATGLALLAHYDADTYNRYSLLRRA